MPADRTEPIVVANGSTDCTVEVAELFGVKVIDLPDQGKLPAIQEALRQLGHQALDPLLILDADTRPLMPKSWHDGMVRNLTRGNQKQPVAVGGPVWFTEGNMLDCFFRSVRRATKAMETCSGRDVNKISQCGPNMGLYLKRHEVLEAILSLPHYWPSEDRAMMTAILSHEGRLMQPVNPALLTVTPLSEAFTSLAEHRKVGPVESRRRTFEAYVQRGAPGSAPFIAE